MHQRVANKSAFAALWLDYPMVVEANEIIPFFARNHERGQRGCVDGQEHDRKQGPHRGHEPRREGPRAIHGYGRLEQQRPHQPVGP